MQQRTTQIIFDEVVTLLKESDLHIHKSENRHQKIYEKDKKLENLLVELKQKNNPLPFYKNDTLLTLAIRVNKPYAVDTILKHFPALLKKRTHDTLAAETKSKKEGLTPLTVAVSLGRVECAEKLLKKGANINDVKAKVPGEIFSYFEEAVLLSDLAMVALLTKAGIEINPNAADLGPIHFQDDKEAKRSNELLRQKLQRPEMLKTLLDAAKDKDTYTYYLSKFKPEPLTVEEFSDVTYAKGSREPKFNKKDLLTSYQVESKTTEKSAEKIGQHVEKNLPETNLNKIRNKAKDQFWEKLINCTKRQDAVQTKFCFFKLDQFIQ